LPFRPTFLRALCVTGALALSVAALTACAPEPGAAPTVTATVTATATITATPAPSAPAGEASPDDPLTALGAWSVCAGIATEYFPVSDWQRLPYSADAVQPQSDGTFRVTVGYDPTGSGSGAAIDCAVGGTVGAPEVLVNGPYDFG
jgi:hypothetical protein